MHDKEHEEGEDCGCSDESCCCEPSMKEMTKEEAEARLTMAASDVWMKMFLEACEKEWKKQGKNIQKLAAMHVKKAKQEWDEKMK